MTQASTMSRFVTMAALAALLVVLLGIVWWASRPGDSPAAAAATPLSPAADLLYRVWSLYATCGAYSDTGESEVTVQHMREVTRFSTCFVRGKHFSLSFESASRYDEPADRNWIWGSGNHIYSALGHAGVLSMEPDFPMACGGGAGVSSGVASSVFLWLEGKPDRRAIERQVWSPSVATVAGSDSQLYYEIALRPYATQLYVDPKSLLVRERIDTIDDDDLHALFAAIKRDDTSWSVATRPSGDRLDSPKVTITHIRYRPNDSARACSGECLPPRSIQSLPPAPRR
jgi:hypothetical protein